MNLDPDLQRILNVGAKIYNTSTLKQGKVYSVNEVDVMIDYGKGVYETHKLESFAELLTSDVIVANSRITLGNDDKFKVKPREKSVTEGIVTLKAIPSEPQVQNLPRPEKQDSNKEPYQIGYINFSTGRFSKESKKGYTKVEFRKAVEKVTLEVDSEMMERLREMGILK